MLNTAAFQPNWTSAPGDTILDILKERDVSIETFAKQMGSSKDDISKLITGSIEITQETSKKLSENLGSSVDFWLRREFQYRKDQVRLKEVAEASWLRLLPTSDMVKYGWIKQEALKSVQSLLDYFAVKSINEWHLKYEAEMSQVSFRTSSSFNQQPGAVAAWLRQGEIQSDPIKCDPWNPSLFKHTLNEIKKLTKIKDPVYFLPKLARLCSKCGVAIAIAKTPNGCQASGVTKFLSQERALIMLSFRYLTDDHFWFTFFHEAAHLILHGNRSVFVEEVEKDRLISQEEKEANDFAAEILVPNSIRPQLMNIALSNKRSIIRFAVIAGVSPGIIIGQLQHAGRIKYSKLNSYKRKYIWDNMPTTITP